MFTSSFRRRRGHRGGRRSPQLPERSCFVQKPARLPACVKLPHQKALFRANQPQDLRHERRASACKTRRPRRRLFNANAPPPAYREVRSRARANLLPGRIRPPKLPNSGIAHPQCAPTSTTAAKKTSAATPMSMPLLQPQSRRESRGRSSPRANWHAPPLIQ